MDSQLKLVKELKALLALLDEKIKQKENMNPVVRLTRILDKEILLPLRNEMGKGLEKMESSVVNANVAHEKPYLERNRSMMCNRYRARAELKSSIPKPSPILRTVEKKNFLRRTESFMSQPACPTRIPVPKLQWEKTCASLHYRSTITAPNKHKSISCSRNLNSPRSVSPQSKRASRPKTANASMNPYAHVKSKINSKPVASGLRNQCSPTNDHMTSNESSVEYISLSPNSSVDQCVREAQRCSSPVRSRHSKSPVAYLKAKVDPRVKRPSRPNSPYRSSNLRSNDTSMEDKHLNNHLDSESYQLSGEDNIQNKGDVIEKQKQLLSLYNELVKLKPAKELQPLEREILRVIQTMGHLEGISRENSFFLNEGAPEFLVAFEKEMTEMFDSWLKLIYDIIYAKQTGLPPPDPALNLFDEICNHLMNFPSDGDPLPSKLQRIEEERRQVMTVIMHSVIALNKEHEDLKDRYFRLEKTQDQIHFELKEELTILGEENKELDAKYSATVEKYNLEKAKADQQEKYKLVIQKDISEVKKIMKWMEGRSCDWENKVKKMDTTCRALEGAIKRRDLFLDREIKLHRELQNKYMDAKNTISKLSSKLDEVNQGRQSLEKTVQDQAEQIISLKDAHDEDVQKRDELVKELENKCKKLKDLKVEIATLKSSAEINCKKQEDKDSVGTDSTVDHDVQQKNALISEQREKIEQMELILIDKSNKIDSLSRQVMSLQRKPHENEIALKAQIKELIYEMKKSKKEMKELEEIVIQKTLELDQRDLQMKQHAQILHARDVLLPLIENNQIFGEDSVKELNQIINKHRKNYSNELSNGLKNGLIERLHSKSNELTEKEYAFHQEKMSDEYNLLVQKQKEIRNLESKVLELNKLLQQKDKFLKEKEAHIQSFQQKIAASNVNRPKGLFTSFFTTEGSIR